jgi:hypothetical protein
MKIWFECSGMWVCEEDSYPVKFGVNWYKHVPGNPKYFKPWFGFSVVLCGFKKVLVFNFVNDYKAYNAKINYRWHNRWRKKK